MMKLDAVKTSEIENSIKYAKHIAIVPSRKSGADAFSAAAGLYNILKQNTKKAQISFVYNGNIPEICEKNNTFDKNNLVREVSKRNLYVKIDYSGVDAAGVKYSTFGNVLSLELPVPKNFNADEKVKTYIGGFDFDVVFVLGAQKWEDLGPTYENLRDEFSGATVVNIDNMEANVKFGDINLVDNSKDNLSSIVYEMASNLRLTPNKDAAKALLLGMTYKEAQV